MGDARREDGARTDACQEQGVFGFWGRRLRANRNPFDLEQYRRHIEAAYITMWEKWQRGEPPQSFSVLRIS
jgi:hypothetical protein